MLITFTVPGQPFGKGSVRVVNGRAFKDARTSDWMARCTLFARQAWGNRAPLDAPLTVTIVAVQERPQSLQPKPRSRIAIAADRIPAPRKPDPDNIAKAVLDATKAAGVYVDDCRVVRLVVEKWYCAVGEAPGVHVAVGVFG